MEFQPQLLGDHPVFAQAALEWVYPEKGIRLRLAKWRGGTRGTVHIFNGRTEYIEKYGDVIAGFLARGFSVTAHDWRGQGLSTRNERFPLRCHIMDFAEFQVDARAIMNACKDMPAPRRLFCHSMGGAIGLRYLMGRHTIDSVIFNAPMWGIYVPATLRPFAKIVSNYVIRHEKEWNCVVGTDDRAYETYVPYRLNLLTRDQEEYARLGERLALFPELATGGPTYYWYFAALREIDELQAAPAPKMPALVFIGRKEKIVNRRDVIAHMKGIENFRLVEFDDAQHEIYIERPEIRKKFWSHIDSFWLID